MASLIERVMLNDFSNFSKDGVITGKQTADFNRVKTFTQNQLLYQGAELIQRDIYFNTPLQYLFE